MKLIKITILLISKLTKTSRFYNIILIGTKKTKQALMPRLQDVLQKRRCVGGKCGKCNGMYVDKQFLLGKCGKQEMWETTVMSPVPSRGQRQAIVLLPRYL
uniref:Uncharacterized protein n=1 Tax=Cacopsylla melanoneura TaxID=428564 RepID=A0A8D9AZN4_9HEMI